uniref:Uncharacterized protein n=1 Tax=Natrinema halophilum TaxID=1699371 RepID=A0A7D5L3J3_9EURY
MTDDECQYVDEQETNEERQAAHRIDSRDDDGQIDHWQEGAEPEADCGDGGTQVHCRG